MTYDITNQLNGERNVFDIPDTGLNDRDRVVVTYLRATLRAGADYTINYAAKTLTLNLTNPPPPIADGSGLVVTVTRYGEVPPPPPPPPCPHCPQPVQFNLREFIEYHPEFIAATDFELSSAWLEATAFPMFSPETTLWDYDPCANILTRKAVLYALVCHILWMRRRAATTNGTGAVITSAKEGSVSVGYTTKPVIPITPTASALKAWLMQTQCGQYVVSMLSVAKIGTPSAISVDDLDDCQNCSCF